MNKEQLTKVAVYAGVAGFFSSLGWRLSVLLRRNIYLLLTIGLAILSMIGAFNFTFSAFARGTSVKKRIVSLLLFLPLCFVGGLVLHFVLAALFAGGAWLITASGFASFDPEIAFMTFGMAPLELTSLFGESEAVLQSMTASAQSIPNAWLQDVSTARNFVELSLMAAPYILFPLVLAVTTWFKEPEYQYIVADEDYEYED